MEYSKLPVFLLKLKSMINVISTLSVGMIKEIKSSSIRLMSLGLQFCQSTLRVPTIPVSKSNIIMLIYRQLNNYGFKNFRQSARQCEFYNENWTHDYRKIHQIMRKRHIQEDVNSTSTFMSSLLLLISNQKQLMANIELIHQQQSMISQNIYNLHTESMKQQELIINLADQI
ncbi:unnamed protein product (macronuclear) [Paramecium tetraurelia]|uniref:HSF-type DNA-binding domain-containing protein n=1 Tax=Paramecium tetraurelia TaxID=5888 RepID=A0DX05_PARTE|nr:uncharacterized protein GSPATT00021204001 [Paramecium tetraurelia]CAK87572.1 unnamed protein product [Paramecium tetraurelia]|eukprot:XP_001454969.1 hypothetical protein (macronuclear) [Paramecium tetraurelia strain d4-2]